MNKFNISPVYSWDSLVPIIKMLAKTKLYATINHVSNLTGEMFSCHFLSSSLINFEIIRLNEWNFITTPNIFHISITILIKLIPPKSYKSHYFRKSYTLWLKIALYGVEAIWSFSQSGFWGKGGYEKLFQHWGKSQVQHFFHPP